MDREIEERIVQEYLNHRRSFSRQPGFLLDSLDKTLEDMHAKFKLYPLAEKFLTEQKTNWYEARILSLKQIGMENSAYQYANFFLKHLSSKNEKQARLKKTLETWFNQSSQIIGGIQRIKITEDDYQQKTNHLPTGIVLSDGSIMECPSLESSLKPSLKNIYGTISEIDKEFLTYYRQKAECFWRIQTGLWPYIHQPIELSPREPIQGSSCEVFYTGVSDFMLSMIRWIAGTESVLRTRQAERVS